VLAGVSAATSAPNSTARFASNGRSRRFSHSISRMPLAPQAACMCHSGFSAHLAGGGPEPTVIRAVPGAVLDEEMGIFHDGIATLRPSELSPATIMGPPESWFCHEHGTRGLPLMGPPACR